MGQPMHLADFLGLAAAHPELHRQLGTLPPLPPDARHCLLCGPERSGKTALLFHLALCLARQGQHVLLLCRRTKLEQVPPLLPAGIQLADPAWQRVAIKYITSGSELLRYVSHLHLMDPPLPDALLVDDLHLLSDLPPPATGAGGGGGDHRPRPRDMALCRILASLYEAVEFASSMKGRPCRLAVTETSHHVEGPRLLYIAQRWLPLALHIRPAGQSNVLSLLSPRPDMPPACLVHLHFSLKHGALSLDAIQPASTSLLRV